VDGADRQAVSGAGAPPYGFGRSRSDRVETEGRGGRPATSRIYREGTGLTDVIADGRAPAASTDAGMMRRVGMNIRDRIPSCARAVNWRSFPRMPPLLYRAELAGRGTCDALSERGSCAPVHRSLKATVHGLAFRGWRGGVRKARTRVSGRDPMSGSPSRAFSPHFRHASANARASRNGRC